MTPTRRRRYKADPDDCMHLPVDQEPISDWALHLDPAATAALDDPDADPVYYNSEYRVLRCGACGYESSEGRPAPEPPAAGVAAKA